MTQPKPDPGRATGDVAAPTKAQQGIASLKTAVARAAPFIDAGAAPDRWRPSELMIIGWSTIASGPSGQRGADNWANDMLVEARNRYAAGFLANPFTEQCVVRDHRKPA